MEQIVNSYNLFVDSSHAVSSGSKGDDFHVNLQESGVHAGDGQFIRVNLENFSMHKNFFDVNKSNKSFRVKTNVTPAGANAELTEQNIENLNQLASDFQQKVATALGGTVTATISPAATVRTPSVISFQVNLPNNITSVTIEFDEDDDTYALLGGDRKLNSVTGDFDSVTCAIAGNVLTVTGKYPAQRTTTPFVYIRAPGLGNTNLETKSMSGGSRASDNDNNTNHSYLLGRAMVSEEFVQYHCNTGREFFLDLRQKQLNSLELRVTDAKNRPIGRIGTQINETAAGTGTKQSTLGNLEFTAVIRFDIIQKKHMHYLETQKEEPSVFPRFSSILNKQDNGRSGYGLSPGF